MASGYTIPVTLRTAADVFARSNAKLDTGSDYCVFQRVLAEDLGLNLEAGHRLRFATAAGNFVAYGHEVMLTAATVTVHCMCYFFEDEAITKNVLVRNGWFNRFRFALDDTGAIPLLYVGRPDQH